MKAHPEMQVVGTHMAQEFYERFSANARFRLQSERTGLIRNASSPSLAKQGILAMIPPLNRLVVCPLLVGRQAHLQTLRLLMDHVQAGRGQSAILVGEAGIGKSRLAAEVAALAAKQDFAVLLGNCFEPDRMMPYAPLA